jgi:hypothetical protein
MKSNKFDILLIFLSISAAFYITLVDAGRVYAGPPFVTDDPETVEYRHWELYIASQINYSRSDISGSAPQVEVNFGVIPDVQLHIIAPALYSITRGKDIELQFLPKIPYETTKWNKARFGYGNTEIGMKVRFLHESDGVPQLGVFPMIEAPTGGSSMGYNGLPQMYFPLYLQKSWGKLTTYGGGGFWYNPGKNTRHYWFAGWQVQYHITEIFTLGGEIFYYSPSSRDAEHRVGANLGMIVDFSENWHLLLSVGRDIIGPNIVFSYLSIQFTI